MAPGKWVCVELRTEVAGHWERRVMVHITWDLRWRTLEPPGNFAMDLVRTQVVVSRGNGPWESSGRSESGTNIRQLIGESRLWVHRH